MEMDDDEYDDFDVDLGYCRCPHCGHEFDTADVEWVDVTVEEEFDDDGEEINKYWPDDVCLVSTDNIKTEHVCVVEPFQHSEPVENTKSGDHVEHNDPVENTKSGDHVEHNDPVENTKSGNHVEHSEPVENTKNVDHVERNEHIEAVEFDLD